ncbi:SusD/RagB family nutrient-binding outer membrane lipoprotein [Rapidithrix thailandica]|uniref:SusD/RagB family nutrient-binding outer membrane lipoprotein n=1 Tax=Rapidithrix thailandica TaxID=413964 RepID=A0AAW9S7W8_9BACT
MRLINYIGSAVLTVALVFSSCNTKEFQDLNINPVAADNINPGFILTYTQLQTSGERYENWRAVLIYQSTMIQHFATLPGYWAGDKYTYIGSYSASLWDRAYRNYVRDLVNLVEITKEDPALINFNAIARIWKVFAMHRLTDHYGDVPYFEAGRGFLDVNFNPRYDAQEDIYMDMLKELDEAAMALSDAEGTPEDQDLIYGGDLAKWKRFAYSMMLRLGMRMTKVNASQAEQWVTRAIAGGVMTSNDDICFIPHDTGPGGLQRNGIGEVFNYDPDSKTYTNDDSPRLSLTFVTYLEDHNDPRLDLYSWVVSGGEPKGMPNGLDATTIQDYEGGSDLDTYSRINPLFVLVSSPMVFQTYAEVAFLLAEAIERGWHAGNAAEMYEAGVWAAMKQYSIYDPSLEIADADIETYLAANPYNPAQWEQILGEQYWVATFLNEYEAYANWRRTDYPKLTPVNYPGNQTNGTIPRRLRYPGGEASLNPDNYQAAINRQGPDLLTTRMWWDVEQ